MSSISLGPITVVVLMNSRSKRASNEQLFCPICKVELEKDIVVGSIVYSCSTHGVWLDQQTLRYIFKGR